MWKLAPFLKPRRGQNRREFTFFTKIIVFPPVHTTTGEPIGKNPLPECQQPQFLHVQGATVSSPVHGKGENRVPHLFSSQNVSPRQEIKNTSQTLRVDSTHIHSADTSNCSRGSGSHSYPKQPFPSAESVGLDRVVLGNSKEIVQGGCSSLENSPNSLQTVLRHKATKECCSRALS